MSTQLLKAIRQQCPIVANEKMERATTGHRHLVWLSDQLVIRARQQSIRLQEEANLLSTLDIPLAPHTLWQGKVADNYVMVENRLPGQSLDIVWHTLGSNQRIELVSSLAGWINNLRHYNDHFFRAAGLSGNFDSWLALLNAMVKNIQKRIKDQTRGMNIQTAINLQRETSRYLDMNILKNNKVPTLIHGDLIMHNLLVDKVKLSGVLDWEFFMFGDPEYEIARIMYYRDCALSYGSAPDSYHDQENTFYNLLLKQFKIAVPNNWDTYRALFYLRSLSWALQSSDPAGNTQELWDSWKNERGTTVRPRPW